MEFSRPEFCSGSYSLLQGIFPTQGLNSGLLHCRQILYQLSPKGSLRILEWVADPFSWGSSWPRNQTRVSCVAGRLFTSWTTRKPLEGRWQIGDNEDIESIRPSMSKKKTGGAMSRTCHTQKLCLYESGALNVLPLHPVYSYHTDIFKSILRITYFLFYFPPINILLRILAIFLLRLRWAKYQANLVSNLTA